IDIVERALAAPQVDQVLDRGDEIFVRQNSFRKIDIDPKFLIDFVTSDATEIVFLRIEKESFEQSTGIRDRRRIAGPKSAIYILESFFLIVRRIFPKRFYDRVIIRDIDDLNLFDAQTHDLANRRQGEWLKRAGNGNFAVKHLRSQHFGCKLFFVEFLAELEVLYAVKKFDDFFIRSVAKRSQECGGEKFAA